MVRRIHISFLFFFLMIRRPPRSTLDRSSAASDVYKRQVFDSKPILVLSAHQINLLSESAIDADGDSLAYSLIAPKNSEITNVNFANGFTAEQFISCLLYTSPSPRDRTRSRMPSSA